MKILKKLSTILVMVTVILGSLFMSKMLSHVLGLTSYLEGIFTTISMEVCVIALVIALFLEGESDVQD